MSDENDSKTNIYSHGYVSMQKEISALRTRLEEAEKLLQVANKRLDWERSAKENAYEHIEEEGKIKAENAALKQKLKAVRKWADTRQADSVIKLRKILDGGRR